MSLDLSPGERAALYALCADLLSREVDADQRSALRRFCGPLVQIEPDLDTWLQGESDEELANLRVEYARLFLLPKGVSPHARSWLDPAIDSTADQIARVTQQTMDALELAQTNREGLLAFDHIGLLYGVASLALASEIAERTEIGEHFERQVLQTWVARFGAALKERSSAPLYRALGGLICELHADREPGLHRDGAIPDPHQR